MSETPNNPQPSEPPTGGSGSGTAPDEPDEFETADSDPPTSGGGGGS
jgi:hypothetical protein